MHSSCCTSECQIQVGKQAPAFTMQGYSQGKMQSYSLADYRGKWVLLFFYPLDFTFVCPTELEELSRKNADFEKINTQVLGVSVDSVYSHQAWMKEMGDFTYPLLSDITKNISSDYNVLLEEEGISLRGAFIIDPEGVVKSIVINDNCIGRNIDELFRTVEALQTGELCPVNWTKGKKTLGKA